MKKILAIVLVSAMVLSLGACGKSGDDQKATTQPETQQSQQEDETDTSKEEKTEDTGVDVSKYASWTKADWDKASDDQQFEVAEKVVIELGEEMMEGYAEIYEQAKDSDAEEELKEEVQNMQSTIATFFETDENATLGELIEASKALMQGDDSE